MRLVIPAKTYRHLIKELHRRGKGTRESGAFLLGPADKAAVGSSSARVTAVAFYDDLDPHCLTGGITFGADGYTSLAQLCRSHGLVVVGDVHTHPSTIVKQSPIDARSPMVAIPGHIAVIAPNYAAGRIRPRHLGVHEFAGTGSWSSTFGSAVEQMIVIEHRPLSPLRFIAHARAAMRFGLRTKGIARA
jgi:proteasome lid subunit RPN8/RPN11